LGKGLGTEINRLTILSLAILALTAFYCTPWRNYAKIGIEVLKLA
jgi:hypothetical protein